MAVGVAQNASSSTYQLTYMAAGKHVMGRSFAALDTDTMKNYSYSYTYGGKEYSVDQRNDFAIKAGAVLFLKIKNQITKLKNSFLHLGQTIVVTV